MCRTHTKVGIKSLQVAKQQLKGPKPQSRILKVRNIEPENLVFLDEAGVLLGLTRTHARSQMGTVYALKPFIAVQRLQ